MEVRVIITGSREWDNRAMMEMAFDDAMDHLQGYGPIVLMHGGARGADTMASEIAFERGMARLRYVADWKEFGKRAGVIRNADMVEDGAALCMGFFKIGAANKGTTDCVTRAEDAGILTWKYYSE